MQPCFSSQNETGGASGISALVFGRPWKVGGYAPSGRPPSSNFHEPAGGKKMLSTVKKLPVGHTSVRGASGMISIKVQQSVLTA
jgi:hypothetical protein